jgi:hypothetical protein
LICNVLVFLFGWSVELSVAAVGRYIAGHGASQAPAGVGSGEGSNKHKHCESRRNKGARPGRGIGQGM